MNAWRPALLYTRNQKCLSVICRREFLRRLRPTEQMLQSIFILALLLLFSCHIFLWILNLCDQQQCSSCRHFQNCGYFHRINVGCQRCIKANVTCHCCAHRFRSRPWLMRTILFLYFLNWYKMRLCSERRWQARIIYIRNYGWNDSLAMLVQGFSCRFWFDHIFFSQQFEVWCSNDYPIWSGTHSMSCLCSMELSIFDWTQFFFQ